MTNYKKVIDKIDDLESSLNSNAIRFCHLSEVTQQPCSKSSCPLATAQMTGKTKKTSSKANGSKKTKGAKKGSKAR